MILFEQGEVYFCVNPIDWRKGINGLFFYTIRVLNIDMSVDNRYIVFLNKKRNALRVIFSREGKRMLIEARLDANLGKFPKVGRDLYSQDACCDLSLDELEALINTGNSKLIYG